MQARALMKARVRVPHGSGAARSAMRRSVMVRAAASTAQAVKVGDMLPSFSVETDASSKKQEVKMSSQVTATLCSPLVC